MDKTKKWRKMIDEYYEHVPAEQFKLNFEAAGFTVNSLRNMENFRNLHHSVPKRSNFTSELSEFEEELIHEYTTNVIPIK